MELCPANIYLKSLNPNEEPKVREIPGRIRPAEERPIAPPAHSTKKKSPRLATTTRRKRISAGPGRALRKTRNRPYLPMRAAEQAPKEELRAPVRAKGPAPIPQALYTR
jgi:hypothetical protein